MYDKGISQLVENEESVKHYDKTDGLFVGKITLESYYIPKQIPTG